MHVADLWQKRGGGGRGSEGEMGQRRGLGGSTVCVAGEEAGRGRPRQAEEVRGG